VIQRDQLKQGVKNSKDRVVLSYSSTAVALVVVSEVQRSPQQKEKGLQEKILCCQRRFWLIFSVASVSLLAGSSIVSLLASF
jgi:hypothetical protein